MTALFSGLKLSYLVEPFRFLKTDKLFSVLFLHPSFVAAVLPPSTFYEKVAFSHTSFGFANFSTLPNKEIARNKCGHKVLEHQLIDVSESSEFWQKKKPIVNKTTTIPY